MMLLARASMGMIWWAFGFSLLYALHGLGCANGWNSVSLAGGSLFRWILVGIWLVLGFGGAIVIRRAWIMPVGFERSLAVACGIAGFFGTALTGTPLMVSSTC